MKEFQLHGIDLNLLVVFETLTPEGSVAAAAARLNKTPSAVSRALARLRDQVGDPLMVKGGGRMQAIVPIPPFLVRFFWSVRTANVFRSSRTANDPALVWVRDLVLTACRSAHEEAAALVKGSLGSDPG